MLAPQTPLYMPLDYYDSFANALLLLHHEAPSRVVHEDVETWLLDASGQERQASLATWAAMLALYMSKTSTSENVAGKASHLGAYFKALETATDGGLVAVFADSKDSALESLLWRLGSNPNVLDASLGALLASGWEPAKLLERVRSVGGFAPGKTALGQTPPGLLLKVLNPFFRGDVRQLAPNPVYALLLETYPLNSGFQPENDARFIRNMLRMAPCSLHDILEYVQAHSWLQPAHIEAFFPLPLSAQNAVHAVHILRCLLKWVEEQKDDLRETARSQLQQHHPEIDALFCMHRELYPDLAERLKTADALGDAFVGIIEQKTGIQSQAFSIP